MEYRHKLKRSAVSFIIEKAIKDIKVDTKRTLRNLIDMGDCFSTTPAQKNFFNLAREILKNRDCQYYQLLQKLARNVDSEVLKTASLNFGYTALNYGAQMIRKNEAVLGNRIPWILCFDFNRKYSDINNIEWIKSIISDAVSLGIYSFIFRVGDCTEYFKDILDICKNHKECCFFAALSPISLTENQIKQVLKVKNLIFSVNITENTLKAKAMLKSLHDYKCFYGFHAYYTNENSEYLLSDEFTNEMMDCGCIFGGFINNDVHEKELENRFYRHVCSVRGKNGQPIFMYDFFTDAKYISNTIFSASDLYISGKGLVKVAGGNFVSLHNFTLSELVKMSKLKFAD